MSERHCVSLSFLFCISLLEGCIPSSKKEKENPYYDESVTKDMIIKYLDTMKKAIRSGDKKRIAEIFFDCKDNYGFYWNAKKRGYRIRSKEEFMRNFYQIMTPQLKEILLGASKDTVSEVGCKGFMINNGTIWFHPERGLIAINKG